MQYCQKEKTVPTHKYWLYVDRIQEFSANLHFVCHNSGEIRCQRIPVNAYVGVDAKGFAWRQGGV